MFILLFMPLHLRVSREILEGVYRGARERQWNVQHFEAVPSAAELRKMIAFWKPSGCLVYAEGGGNPLPRPFPAGIPVVTLSDRNPKHNTVNQDVRETVRLALDELVQAGARAFAYVGPRRASSWNRERRAEFLARVRRLGGAAKTFAFDPDAADDPRLPEFLRRLKPPAGVLIASDHLAGRVIHAANHVGIRIPSDVAFVSVDNDPLVCDHLQPTLSSVRLDFRSAGERMVGLLDGILRDPRHAPRAATYAPTGVCRRESTRVVRLHPRIEKALAFIRREALSPIGVDDVAAAIGLTRRSAERLFAAQAPESIAAAIRAVRIEHAKKALAETNDAIEFIADTCGFKSPAHLKTVFRKATGLTMRAYRLHARG